MIRIATVGTSSITDSLLDAIAKCDGVTFAGAYSRNRENATTYTNQHGGWHAFTTFEKLAGAGDVDAVYIASPNALHHDQALACIRNGKHVLVEKPLGVNAREAREVFDAAADAGVVAMEAMRPLHDPAFRTCQAALPDLGRIRRVSLRFGKYSSRYGEIKAGRHTNIFDCAMGTGALMDIGIYTVEPLVALFGTPQSISCASVLLDESTRGITNGAIDGAGTILARYPTMTASLHYSKITNDMSQSEIEGEDGTMLINAISMPTRALMNLRTATTATGGYSNTSTKSYVLDLPETPNNMVCELDDFAQAIAAVQKGAKPADAPAGPYGTIGQFGEATLVALTLMDEARAQSGIVFPADKQRA